MLHRSFKPAKCKTALKLASSRIKLMKNKRDAQVKQLKRELAQLLESGNVQTARIRVEHMVREQKTMAAYDLLEIYCEVIAVRLPMIESQKNCPVDLKEAISSVIFASPRCDDIPELKDVRKHMTAKYGKEFASAAVELRPNCGVGRLLVEKLSATAPDGPTKVKILSAIAEEHNITWDPNSFSGGDSNPPEDLLNGPNTFSKASETLVDLPNVPSARPIHSDKGSSNVQVSPKSNERHDFPVNFHEQNARSSFRSRTDVNANEAKQSGAFHPELRHTGSSDARTEFRHPHSLQGQPYSPQSQPYSPQGQPYSPQRQPYSSQGQPYSPGSQSWNMEFTDATAAAHAAAESAERASMAARAAAELSSRGNSTWQYSTESQRDKESQRYADSTLRNEHHAKGPVNNAFHGRNSRMHFEQIDGKQQHDVSGIDENFQRENPKSTGKSSRSASLKSSAADVDANQLENNLQMADGYSQNNSSELEHSDLLGQASFKKQSSKSDVEFVNKLQGGVDSQSVDVYETVRFRKQFSPASSHSQSSTFSDDHDVVSNINSQSLGEDANENPFAAGDNGVVQRNYNRINSQEIATAVNSQSLGEDANENPFAAGDNGVVQRNSNHMNSHENATAVFDDSGSDDDVFNIGKEGGHEDHDYSLNFSSPSRQSPANVFANENAWSDRQNFNGSLGKSISRSHLYTEHRSDPIFSESLTSSRVPSQSDNMFPATFDDYDGPSSESGEELEKTKFGRSTDTKKHNIYSRTSEMTEDVTTRLAGAKEDSELLKQSSLDSVKELNLGLLTKGLDKTMLGRSTDTSKHNMYSRTSEMAQDDTPRVAEAKEDAKLLKQSSLESGTELNFGLLSGGLRNKGIRHPPYILSPTANASFSKKIAEDTSTKVEESPAASVKVSISPRATSQEPYNRKVSAEAIKKPSTLSYFASRDDYLDDEPTQQTSKGSQETYYKKPVLEENKKFRSRTQVRDFDSDDSDSEDDSPKQVSMSKAHSNTTSFSRRTRVSPPSNSERSSYSKTPVLSYSSVSPSYGKERNSSSRTMYNTETRPERQSRNNSSGALGSSGQSRLAEQAAAYKPNSPSKRPSFAESLKSSAKEQRSNSVPKKEKPDSTQQSSKTSSVESPSKERAAHVHPKLPDYDTFVARLQSIRQNHQ